MPWLCKVRQPQHPKLINWLGPGNWGGKKSRSRLEIHLQTTSEGLFKAFPTAGQGVELVASPHCSLLESWSLWNVGAKERRAEERGGSCAKLLS